MTILAEDAAHMNLSVRAEIAVFVNASFPGKTPKDVCKDEPLAGGSGSQAATASDLPAPQRFRLCKSSKKKWSRCEVVISATSVFLQTAEQITWRPKSMLAMHGCDSNGHRVSFRNPRGTPIVPSG